MKALIVETPDGIGISIDSKGVEPGVFNILTDAELNEERRKAFDAGRMGDCPVVDIIDTGDGVTKTNIYGEWKDKFEEFDDYLAWEKLNNPET